MNGIPDSVVNKAVLGELTFGEVWALVKDQVHEVRIEDREGETSFTTFHTKNGVSLGLSNNSADNEDSLPDFHFDLNTKVKVKGDCLEVFCENWLVDVEKVSVYFLFHPKPQVVNLGFLLGC